MAPRPWAKRVVNLNSLKGFSRDLIQKKTSAKTRTMRRGVALPQTSNNSSITVESVVNSEGQVTLPKELQKHLGIEDECRIRFVIPVDGPVQLERLSYELEDLWRIADGCDKPEGCMFLEEMNEAKAMRSDTMSFDEGGLERLS